MPGGFNPRRVSLLPSSFHSMMSSDPSGSTHIGVVIPAAGSGSRLGNDQPKSLIPLLGKSLLGWSLEAIARAVICEEIVVAAPEGALQEAAAAVDSIGLPLSRVRVIPGGDERQDSVRLGLEALTTECGVVIIHDAARPLVAADVVRRSVEIALTGEGAIAAVPAKDTIIQSDSQEYVMDYPNRSELWMVQTPQTFPYPEIIAAHRKAAEQGHHVTDDGALFLWAGGKVRMVLSDYTNLKITTPEDLHVAETLLKERQCE